MAFFSVIIPLYNKEKYILDTLKTVINQTFTDFEIIIINDGSTDNSLNELKKINDSRLEVITTKNKGVSHARNLGITKSTGTYISFLDADDTWKTNHLTNLNKLITDFPNAKLYFTSYLTQYSPKVSKTRKVNNITKTYRGYIDNYFFNSKLDAISLTGNSAIKTIVFDKNMIFDTNMKSGQDTDLWTRLALKYRSVIDNSSETFTHINRQKSLSNSVSVQDRILFIDKFSEKEISNPDFKKYMDSNRYSIALNYKMSNKNKTSKSILLKVDRNNLNYKQKIILYLPSFLLKIVYQLKKRMDNSGIFFRLYN